MPRLHLASLVIAFIVKNAKTTTLDLLARVSVLEGIAGVKPGTWMKDKVPEKEIVEVFGPNVKETWLSRRDSGLITAVRRSLEPLLQGTSTTADDILQGALIGLGSTGEVTRLPLFHGVGKAPGFTVAKVKAGVFVPRDVLAVARTYARRRAIDVLRAQARRPGIVRVDGDEVKPGTGPELIDLVVNVLVDPGHRMHGASVRPGDRTSTRHKHRGCDGVVVTQPFPGRDAAQREGMRSAISARRTLRESTARMSVK